MPGFRFFLFDPKHLLVVEGVILHGPNAEYPDAVLFGLLDRAAQGLLFLYHLSFLKRPLYVLFLQCFSSELVLACMQDVEPLELGGGHVVVWVVLEATVLEKVLQRVCVGSVLAT